MSDATKLAGSTSSRKALGEAAGDEQAQHCVEATDGPSAVRDQVVVTFREQAQQRRVILEANGPQFRVPQRNNRSRPSVVRVGLVAPCVVEKPNPCRQCGWHVEHGLTSRDELLG